MNHKIITLACFITLSFTCAAQKLVKFDNSHIRYSGRVAMRDSAAELSWSATDIRFNFNGTQVSAILRDERADNFYNVIVDGAVTQVLRLEKGKKTYTLATGLHPGKHTLELFKRTEWAMGKTWLYGFELPQGAIVLSAPDAPKRKIEFFGNSITCGYADEDTTGKDRGTGPYENAYLSYATLTAKHFNADLHITAKSGIGVMVSWFPLIMPEMYDRLDATDADSKWDFSKYTPDVVVINLFQNDSWITQQPNNEQFKARFGATPPTEDFIINAYRNFVKIVRSKYPKARIVCILGSTDATKAGSPWPGYIEKAVLGLNDKKIYIHNIPYKNTPGHPSVKEQRAMADDLIGFIEANKMWK